MVRMSEQNTIRESWFLSFTKKSESTKSKSCVRESPLPRVERELEVFFNCREHTRQHAVAHAPEGVAVDVEAGEHVRAPFVFKVELRQVLTKQHRADPNPE